MGDGMSDATRGSGADGWYQRRPWEQSPARTNQAVGPDPTAMEQLVSDRLKLFLQPPPPPPQRVLFAPRFGYAQDEPSITDIIQVDVEFPQPVDTFSRDTYGSYQGSSTPSLTDDLGRS